MFSQWAQIETAAESGVLEGREDDRKEKYSGVLQPREKRTLHFEKSIEEMGGQCRDLNSSYCTHT